MAYQHAQLIEDSQVIDNRLNVPLCVDCNSLIQTNLLHEAILTLAKKYLIGLLLLPFWLLKGTAYLSNQLAKHVHFDCNTLPFNKDVIAAINKAVREKRRVALVTSYPAKWAHAIAFHLGESVEVISDRHKGQELVQLFGTRGFDYIGNLSTDESLWKQVRHAFVVTSSQEAFSRIKNASETSEQVLKKAPNIASFLRALRIHQWMKNFLVFIPVLAAYRFNNLDALAASALAFLSFSLCASSVYVLNDLLDLEADRLHIRKRNRPFASGVIPVSIGALLVPFLLGISICIALLLPSNFLLVVIAYYVITMAYSVRLKRQVVVDVMLLAGLYTMRIVAGAAAAFVVPSFWLLAFSMFIFLSLAIIKRCSELYVVAQQSMQYASGRGYSVSDLPVLTSIGVAAGLGSVLVFSLYLHSPEVAAGYQNAMWLWVLPPVLLYWICRMWIKTLRGEVDDDPVVFAARDWQSLTVLLVFGCSIIAAIYL